MKHQYTYSETEDGYMQCTHWLAGCLTIQFKSITAGCLTIQFKSITAGCLTIQFKQIKAGC